MARQVRISCDAPGVAKVSVSISQEELIDLIARSDGGSLRAEYDSGGRKLVIEPDE